MDTMREPRTVILITDSRWSFLGSRREPEDVGKKLFQLGTNAGAIYSGHVESAERGIGRVKRLLRSSRVTADRLPEIAERLRAAHRQVGYGQVLNVVIAFRDDDRARLVSLTSSEDFIPMPVEGIQVLADERTREAFRQGLDSVVDQTFRQTLSVPFDHLTGVRWVVSAMDLFVMNPKFDRTVGGKLQCGVIDDRGVVRMGYARSRKPTGPWEMRSAAASDLKSYFEPHGRLR